MDDGLFETNRKPHGKRKITNMKYQWHKGCEYQCKICNDTRDSIEHIKKHMKRFHPLLQHTDPSNYHMIREEFFVCVLCGEKMHRDYKVIKIHLKKHKISMTEYARDHVNSG